jgi:hypothetical protein
MHVHVMDRVPSIISPHTDVINQWNPYSNILVNVWRRACLAAGAQRILVRCTLAVTVELEALTALKTLSSVLRRVLTRSPCISTHQTPRNVVSVFVIGFV